MEHTYLLDGLFFTGYTDKSQLEINYCTQMASLRFLHYLAVGCRWLLALVLLSAGVPKLFGLDRFAETVAAYGLIPDAVVSPVAFFIVVLEIVAGIGLLLQKKWALSLTAALMIVFIAVLAYGIWLGLDIDCGCFGPEDAGARGFSSLRTALVRDIVLLLPLIYLFLKPVFTSLLNKGVSR